MTTPLKRYRVWCQTESAYVFAWSTTEPTDCPNNAAHTITTARTAIVGRRDILSLIVDPVIEPVVPGASLVVANDRPAIEIATDTTGYGAIQCLWPHVADAKAHVVLCISFILKAVGTGTNVRISARIKADGDGDDSSVSWSDSQMDDVTVSYTTLGEVFRTSIVLDASDFELDDAIALQVGRDGSHVNDTCSEAIQIIGVKAEAC